MVDIMIIVMLYNLLIKEINIGGGLGICYIEIDDFFSIEIWVYKVSIVMVDVCKVR